MNIISSIGAVLVEWMIKGLAALVAQWIKKQEAQKQIEAQAQKDKEALDNAKTAEDKAKAVTDIAHDSFS